MFKLVLHLFSSLERGRRIRGIGKGKFTRRLVSAKDQCLRFPTPWRTHFRCLREGSKRLCWKELAAYQEKGLQGHLVLTAEEDEEPSLNAKEYDPALPPTDLFQKRKKEQQFMRTKEGEEESEEGTEVPMPEFFLALLIRVLDSKSGLCIKIAPLVFSERKRRR